MDYADGTTSRYTPVSAGPDWLTATAKRGSEGRPFIECGNALVRAARAAGGDVQPATLRDYVGHRTDGLFFGIRKEDSIIILSGQRASSDHGKVTQLASNVSRLDLQVTVFTHGEQPRLGLHAYRRLSRLPPRRGARPKLTYIESKPQGETLNYGSRRSDNYGRLYDKASESELGPACTLWRYEVEFKRSAARRFAHALACSVSAATDTRHIVHRWWANRGLEPAWSLDEHQVILDTPIEARERDVLSWFRSSVSRTVANAVNRYGLDAVLEALALTQLVQPLEVSNALARRRRAGSTKHLR